MAGEKSIWSDFVKAGNIVTGEAKLITGSSSIAFEGANSSVQIGDNVILEDVDIQMPQGGATLIIGNGVQLKGVIQIGADGTISIGSDTIFERNSHLSAWEGASIVIGKECLFSDVEIRTSDMHSVMNIVTGARINPPRDVVVEDRVWVGEGVTIYKGVTIGCGSVIGGYSIVTKPIARFASAVGVPAEVRMTQVTWQRALIPTKPKKAKSIGSGAFMPTKAELGEYISKKKFSSVIFFVTEYLKLSGKTFFEMETYAQFYLAKAHLELGEVDLAREYLEVVVSSNPNHKVALGLLETLTKSPLNDRADGVPGSAESNATRLS